MVDALATKFEPMRSAATASHRASGPTATRFRRTRHHPRATSAAVQTNALRPHGSAPSNTSPATPSRAPPARASRPSFVVRLTVLIPRRPPGARRTAAPAREKRRPRPRGPPRRSPATLSRRSTAPRTPIPTAESRRAAARRRCGPRGRRPAAGRPPRSPSGRSSPARAAARGALPPRSRSRRRRPRWRATRGRPRRPAQRPLPSITIATCREELCDIKRNLKKKSSPVTGGVNQRFHVVQVALQRAPPGAGEPVLGLGDPAFERLGARDVLRVLQPARVHAQVPVRRLEQRLELVEAQRVVHGERAHDAETDALVNQAVEVGRAQAAP